MEHNFTPGEIEANFVQVVVNFQAIRYDKFTQSEATSLNSFVSDIGGQLGYFNTSVVELFGELIGLQLFPRLWGHTDLYGYGQLQEKAKRS